MPPAIGKSALSVAFVRPSVRPSVSYIANNLKTQRPSVSKFGTKVPRLWCHLRTSFKVIWLKVKVTRPINADIHRALGLYLPNGKAYEIQTWYMHGGRRPASATGAMASEVKGQGRKVTWSVWAVLAQWCTCAIIRGRRGYTMLAKLLVYNITVWTVFQTVLTATFNSYGNR